MFRKAYNFTFRLSPNSAVRILDYRVSDLQKRLNKLKSRNAEQRTYLDMLLVEGAEMSNKTTQRMKVNPKVFFISTSNKSKFI